MCSLRSHVNRLGLEQSETPPRASGAMGMAPSIGQLSDIMEGGNPLPPTSLRLRENGIPVLEDGF
jgi:hypothetical protein